MFASAQVGQFSTGGVGQFYSGANKRRKIKTETLSDVTKEQAGAILAERKASVKRGEFVPTGR